MPKSNPSIKRRKLRDELFPDAERSWLGHEEIGYFCAPRTLPLVLALIRSKEFSGNQDPSPVYLDLLARHMGDGLVEIRIEEDHAFSAGYQGGRATRTWRDRMKILENVGLIKTVQKGNRQYAYVLLVHPTIVIERLREEGRVDDAWWTSYRTRQQETKEPTADEL